MLIDVVTTATLRPEVLRKTYQSFFTKLFNDKYEYRLILNVDPIGEDISPLDVVEVAKEFFDRVIFRVSEKPSFTCAIKWVWSKVETDLVFHLEDMWRMRNPVNFDHLVYVLQNYANIAYIHLHKFVLSDGSPAPWFYKHYHKPDDRKLFLQVEKPMSSPGLFRGEFCRGFSQIMNETDNAELQLWGDRDYARDQLAPITTKQFLSEWDYAIYTGSWRFPFWRCRVADTARYHGWVWKRDHGFRKKHPWAPWEKVNKRKNKT